MKPKFLYFCIAVLAFVACEKNTNETPVSDGLNEAYNAMQQLINDGVDYDITNVEEAIVSVVPYWQLDAVLGYNDDFTRVETIYRDFADVSGRGEDTRIYGFTSDAILCYDIDSEDNTIIREVGSWSFEPRSLMLSLYIPQFGSVDAIDMECVLLSITDESMVLEWVNADGAMRASLRPAMSYDTLFHKSVTMFVDEIMSECQHNDSEAIVNGLSGEWVVDSLLFYDQEWQNVEQAHLFCGVWYAAGGSSSRYTFEDDGTGVHYSMLTPPQSGEVATNFEWRYDADNGVLTLCYDEYNDVLPITGYSGEYIVSDKKTNTGNNCRTIFKRK